MCRCRHLAASCSGPGPDYSRSWPPHSSQTQGSCQMPKNYKKYRGSWIVVAGAGAGCGGQLDRSLQKPIRTPPLGSLISEHKYFMVNTNILWPTDLLFVNFIRGSRVLTRQLVVASNETPRDCLQSLDHRKVLFWRCRISTMFDYDYIYQKNQSIFYYNTKKENFFTK